MADIFDVIASIPVDRIALYTDELYSESVASSRSGVPLFEFDEGPAMVCDLSNVEFTKWPRAHFAAHVAFAAAVQSSFGQDINVQLVVVTGEVEEYPGTMKGRMAIVLERPDEISRRWLTVLSIIALAPQLTGAGYLSLLDHFFAGSSRLPPNIAKEFLRRYRLPIFNSLYQAIVDDDRLYNSLSSVPAFRISDVLKRMGLHTVRGTKRREADADTVEEFVGPAIGLLEGREPWEEPPIELQPTNHADVLVHEFVHAATFVYGLVEWLGRHRKEVLQQLMRSPMSNIIIEMNPEGRSGTTGIDWFEHFVLRKLKTDYVATALSHIVYYASCISPTIVGLLSSSPDYRISGWAAGMSFQTIKAGGLPLNHATVQVTDDLKANKRKLLALARRMIQYIRSHPEFGPVIRQYIKQPGDRKFVVSIPLEDAIKMYSPI